MINVLLVIKIIASKCNFKFVAHKIKTLKRKCKLWPIYKKSDLWENGQGM